MAYLYVKTHNTTGLKYLGKTVGDPFKYKGSGKYWKSHLKIHGDDVTTVILLQTESKEELRETGLFFSKLWNIVQSDDWANLTEEEGAGGNTWDKRGRIISEAARLKMSKTRKGRKFTAEHRENMKGKIMPDHVRKMLSDIKKGVPRPRVICPRCGGDFDVGNFKRWHEPQCAI